MCKRNLQSMPSFHVTVILQKWTTCRLLIFFFNSRNTAYSRVMLISFFDCVFRCFREMKNCLENFLTQATNKRAVHIHHNFVRNSLSRRVLWENLSGRANDDVWWIYVPYRSEVIRKHNCQFLHTSCWRTWG